MGWGGGCSGRYDDGVKKRVVMLLLLLVGGAIVNVAVAWGSAWLLPPYAGSGTPLRERISSSQLRWGISRRDAVSVSRMTAMVITSSQLNFPSGPPIGGYPNWSDWPEDLEAAGNPARTHIVEVRGWPLKAMRSRWVSPAWVSGIPLPPRKPNPPSVTLIDEQRALPTEILWPGFAINTVFYAAILWLLFAATFALRRWRRIKRGLCVKCAYPVGTSEVCTECGAAVNAPRRMAPPASRSSP